MATSWAPTAAEVDAILLSLKVAGACAVLSAVPGVAMGWLLARRRFWGKAALDAFVHLPLVLPPVVVGYLLLLSLGRNRPLGRWLHETLGLDLAFTFWGAVMASAVIGFPLLVRAVRLAVELVDTRLERAASTLGASPLRVFLTVTLPLALPGILTGVLLAFTRSLGEFGATITFAGNIEGETRTLSLALFTLTQSAGAEQPALRLVLISLALSFAALLISDRLARRAAPAREDEAC